MNSKHPLAASVPRIALLAAVAALALVYLFSLSAAPDARAGGGAGPSAGSDPSATQSQQKRKYRRLYRQKSTRNKRWARRTARCESGRDPKAIGGGGRYRGAFQFLRSTWRAAPKSPGGDPIKYNYKTQAVVAMALKKREGRHHWPNCG